MFIRNLPIKSNFLRDWIWFVLLTRLPTDDISPKSELSPFRRGKKRGECSEAGLLKLICSQALTMQKKGKRVESLPRKHFWEPCGEPSFFHAWQAITHNSCYQTLYILNGWWNIELFNTYFNNEIMATTPLTCIKCISSNLLCLINRLLYNICTHVIFFCQDKWKVNVPDE